MKIATRYINKVKSFLDRNWNLLRNRGECVNLIPVQNWTKYNDVICIGNLDLRYLGCGVYKVIS